MKRAITSLALDARVVRTARSALGRTMHRATRIVTLAALILATSSATVAAQGAPSPGASSQAISNSGYFDDTTSTRFPVSLGALRYKSLMDYREKGSGLGKSLKYGAPRIKADIYVYDRSQRGIQSGAESPAVQRELVQALNDVQMAEELGVYRDVSATRPDVLKIEVEGGKRSFVWARMAYKETKNPNVELSSFAFLTGYRANFVKVRFTGLASDFEERTGPGWPILFGFLESLAHVIGND
jgi:hypothetical protein